MNFRLFYLFILFGFCKIYSQSQANLKCGGCFELIGIKDFQLNTLKEDINESLTSIDDKVKIIDSFFFIDSLKIDDKKYEIIYYLNFIENQLKNYHFEIRGDTKLYNIIMDKLQIEKNNSFKNFTNTKYKYSFFSSNEFCKRYLHSRLSLDKQFIKGGVEYSR